MSHLSTHSYTIEEGFAQLGATTSDDFIQLGTIRDDPCMLQPYQSRPALYQRTCVCHITLSRYFRDPPTTTPPCAHSSLRTHKSFAPSNKATTCNHPNDCTQHPSTLPTDPPTNRPTVQPTIRPTDHSTNRPTDQHKTSTAEIDGLGTSHRRTELQCVAPRLLSAKKVRHPNGRATKNRSTRLDVVIFPVC